PTDDDGNITDSSRYFVRWSTAREEAKSTTLQIGGQTHRGYLAAITTKDEFSFLNDNVTGGSGTLYPAWVGGSDAGTEGVWNWVDGPEAKQFGGDSLFVIEQYDPEGRLLQNSGEGLYLDFNGNYSWPNYGLLMRDGNGDVVKDPTTGYNLVVNLDQGMYCSQAHADINAARQSYLDNGPEIDTTPFGSTITCNINSYWGYNYLTIVLKDANGKTYDYESDLFFHLDGTGNYSVDADGNYLAVRPNTSDMNYVTTTTKNYAGANFWGPDSNTEPGSETPDYCTQRGVRGICSLNQADMTGFSQYNSYYVYWSNGAGYHTGNWDGTGVKPGDGVYNPQPDNYAGNDSHGEDALIINWCARNAGAGNWSSATQETLYGNPDYYCTPGWNDLTAGDWGRASTVYTGPDADTPNQIGTTDYVIEYCGYSDETSCVAPATAVVSTAFSVASSSCPATGTPQLSVSYSAPGVDTTDLTSSTMATETFDNVAAGGWINDQMTNVGYLSGTTAAFPAGVLSGSGGTGNFIAAVDTYLTLPTTECYIGFWWSAGNAANYVDLLDGSDNVLATFNASDLVNALGGCPNPYCGNPNMNYGNGNELYAYVHMRLPTGFQKVHFYGQGFELDTISTSVTVPGRATNETSLTGPVTMGLTAPEVIPVDPTVTNVTIPELLVSGDPNASLCLIQVADSAGNPFENSSLNFTVPAGDPVTSQTVGPYSVISGATADVVTTSGHLVISRSDASLLVGLQSVFVRVSAVAGQTPDSAACGSGTSAIVELRPIGLDLTQVFDISITDHSN
ncbi:MAG: hypothetical protein RLZZ06_467, partial [Actinomycetota bacterium]